MPRRSRLALASTVALAFLCSLAGCSPSFFRQPLSESLTPATAEEIAAVHPAEALRSDLDALVDLHEAACPEPYLRVDRATIHALRDRLKSAIDRPMTRREFLPFVMELQSAYAIDHMAQSVPLEDIVASIRAGERILPFRVSLDQGSLRIIAVAEEEHGLEPGDVVVRIGDQSAAEVIARLRRLVPGESERFQSLRLRSSFPAYAWAAGIVPPLDVEVERANGERVVTRVEGVRSEQRATERRLTPNPPPAGSGVTPVDSEVLVESAPYRCTLTRGDIAFIEFPTMSSELYEQWNRFLVDAISAAKGRGCQGLIVDIRRNGGGDSQLGDLLLAHITERPYRMAGGVVWRRSEAGLASLTQSVKPAWRWLVPAMMSTLSPEYAKLKDGEDLTGMSEASAPKRSEPFFDRPTVLLIGEGTFSSAMMLADAARTYDLMTTIGAPTGGLPTSLGELGFWTLPNSRFTVQFCQKKFLRASGDPKDMGPVVPHIQVDPQAEGVRGPDAALERAIEFLHGARSVGAETDHRVDTPRT